MLGFIIDDPRTMLAAPEHGMRPLLQAKPLNRLVLHKEKFVGSGDNSNVNFCYVIKTADRFLLNQTVKKSARMRV